MVRDHLLLERSASWLLPLELMFRLGAFQNLWARTQPSWRAVPVVVIGAEHDRLVGRDALRRTAAAHQVEAELIPGVGHCMMGRVGGDPERAGRAILAALQEAARFPEQRGRDES